MPIFFNKVTPVEPVRQQQQPKSFAEIVAEIKATATDKTSYTGNNTGKVFTRKTN